MAGPWGRLADDSLRNGESMTGSLQNAPATSQALPTFKQQAQRRFIRSAVRIGVPHPTILAPITEELAATGRVYSRQHGSQKWHHLLPARPKVAHVPPLQETIVLRAHPVWSKGDARLGEGGTGSRIGGVDAASPSEVASPPCSTNVADSAWRRSPGSTPGPASATSPWEASAGLRSPVDPVSRRPRRVKPRRASGQI